MSDITTLVRAVACRALGPQSPAIDSIVSQTMAELTSAIREHLITTDIRTYAKNLAKVNATRAFASARLTTVGTGRKATGQAVRDAAHTARCQAGLNTLVAELQRGAAVREAALSATKVGRELAAA